MYHDFQSIGCRRHASAWAQGAADATTEEAVVKQSLVQQEN